MGLGTLFGTSNRKLILNRTQRMINTISLFMISSGMITTAINMATLISFIASPNTLAFQVFSVLGFKAYVNTLMAILNIRNLIHYNLSHTSNVITDGLNGLSGSGSDNTATLSFRAATAPHAVSRTQDYDIPLNENVLGKPSGSFQAA
ncbi:hypothetical protein E1B28_009305 [Marasmius oreades]|uniref:DUF6534 domain-containing protein n=1 Tax=Marasmius oreades TaxID=181124 RepID=A0A9P7S1G6_9AGAR|nr:uncharacterized protein E1B28_009305 [Marasmius oreades]KAG7093006.1 hypothetical protein E1B28_009305 [Marasmius oreades]